MGSLVATSVPLVLAALAGVLLYSVPDAQAAHSHAHAPPLEEPIPPIPINFDVVERDGEPIAGIDWLAPQLADASEHYTKLGLRFAVVSLRHHAGAQRVETRGDRDSFNYLYVYGSVNVFVVEALKDIDTTSTYERGVVWGDENDRAKKYIFMQAGSPPGVLTHEMGHILGLPHSHQIDNVMSYSRSHQQSPFFVPYQGAVMRAYARKYFQTHWLIEPPADKTVE